MKTPPCRFDDLLPVLVSSYKEGRLVPFLGAGMSAGRLTLWEKFTENLETEAGIPHDPRLQLSKDVRAQRAAEHIRYSRGSDCYFAAVGRALSLEGSLPPVPAQTLALAAIRWPLVVSTNYDDLYLGACLSQRQLQQTEQGAGMDIRVAGRSPKDCKLVLSALHGPLDGQHLWHVQGFLGGQMGNGTENTVEGLDDLREQLVIGHADYRAVTNSSPHFRRCFGELFHSRSFLFLGSNLQEDYFLNLFGEVLDLCGPSHIPHFAFAQKGTVDAGFLADEMNITVCEYACQDMLPVWLDRLRAAIEKPAVRNTGWSYSLKSNDGAKIRLRIVTSPAAVAPGPDEVLALVARQEHGRPVLKGPYQGLDPDTAVLRTVKKHVVQIGDADIFAVTAHCRNDEETALGDGYQEDDDAVDRAVSELLDEVEVRGIADRSAHKIVHFQLSPDGGTVPPVFAFVKALRAVGAWNRDRKPANSSMEITLFLHVQSDVEFNLTSGRINVQELLTSELIRFWAIVIPDARKEPIRRVLHYPDATRLTDVLDDLSVPFGKTNSEWIISVCPRPRMTGAKNSTCNLDKDATLSSVGVVFGSVLTIERSKTTECTSQAAAGH